MFKKVLSYGRDNNGLRPSAKKGDDTMKKLAKHFGALAEAARKPNRSLPSLTQEKMVQMETVFGADWYKKKKQSWKTEEEQLIWLREFIKNKQLEASDWYGIRVEDFKPGGLGLIDKYNNSVKAMLDVLGSRLYPGFTWIEWNFGRVITWGIPYRDDYKVDKENTCKYEIFKEKIMKGDILSQNEIPLFRRFMDFIIKEEKIADIHSLTHGLLLKHNGTGLCSVGPDFPTLLQLAYPEKTIHKFLLHPIRRGFWDDDTNLRMTLEYYCKQTIVPIERLIEIPKNDIVLFGGWYGLKKIRENGSWIELLCRAFPEVKWNPFDVSRISWTPENKRDVLQQIARCEEWDSPDDYYNLTVSLADNYNIRTLMLHYNNSPICLLRELKPEHEWKEWKFAKSNKCWGDGKEPNIQRIRAFFDDFKEENDMKSLDDFTQYIVKEFPQGILGYYQFNLFKCLSQVYPEHHWDESTFQAVNYSKVSIRCINDLMKILSIIIQHKLNGGEKKIGKNPVDGFYEAQTMADIDSILEKLPSYCHITKHSNSMIIVFQFHGTWWHGHPDFYKANDIHPCSKKTYGELYDNTIETTKKLSETCHVVEIWEHDYNSY